MGSATMLVVTTCIMVGWRFSCSELFPLRWATDNIYYYFPCSSAARSTLTQKRLGLQDHVFLCTRYVRPISGCNWCTFCVGLIDVASTPYSVVSKFWRRPGNEAIFLPLVNQTISASTLLLRSPAPAKGYNVTVSTEHM